MQSIQLTSFELNPPRKSLIQYLTRVSWDNYVELVLRGAATFISGIALIAVTAMPCKAPEEVKIVERECIVRRKRSKKFGTLIIAGDNKTTYVHWYEAKGKIHADTIVDGMGK